MLLYSPVLFVVSTILLTTGLFLWSLAYKITLFLFGIFTLTLHLRKVNGILSGFTLNQMYLFVGLAKRKNALLWDRGEK
jgi:hypothetical protein